LASGGEERSRRRRDYRPTVEGLEALRLLSAAQAHLLPGMVVERDSLAESGHEPLTSGPEAHPSPVSNETWDAALGLTRLADLLSDSGTTSGASAPSASAATAGTASQAIDPALVNSGLSQLKRYLNRTWARAGIPAQVHDDSSQAVYATLLQNLGRQQFDALVGEVGQWGIRDVFSRETSDGIAFFRAVDMVKKRAQREKVHQSLDGVDVPSHRGDQQARAALRAALQDAISQSLNPREAALIHDTLLGKTPAEIALQWGVAPKTISNEKSRVIQKLREALVDQELN
jgi:DNA-binding NarL/FixJ family response regulator